MRSVHALASLLIALALASNAFAAPRKPKREELARAHALDKEGGQAYAEGRYADAARAYDDAYKLGGPPFELWNVAKCHLRLDQNDQAADYLQRYLATPKLPRADREEASRQLDALKKRSSALTVTSTPSDAQVTLDGKPVDGRTPVTVTVSPGTHTIAVTVTGAPPYTRKVEARYGHALTVDAALSGGEDRSAPPDNPYAGAPIEPVEHEGDWSRNEIMLRAALTVAAPRFGSIGGSASVGVLATGAYQVTDFGTTGVLAVGGLFALSRDHWTNLSHASNDVKGACAIPNAEAATAFALFGIGTASFALAERLRLAGIGGIGIAGYGVSVVGSDLFDPSCDPSPGLRPAILFGAQIDYALTKIVRITAYPLTWQVQPAFGGTRGAPSDATGAWMRFGIGVGGGVDF